MGLFGLFISCKQEVTDWQHLDLEKDKIWGISTHKAYKELPSDKNPTPVIVAILDGGVEVTHEDLKNVLWINRGEISENKLDDDNNGYVDDLHGWNFLGSEKGSIRFDNLLLTRKVQEGRLLFGNRKMNEIPLQQREEYKKFAEMSKLLEKERMGMMEAKFRLERIKETLEKMLTRNGLDSFTLKQIQKITPQNDAENQVRSLLNVKLSTKTFREAFEEDILERIEFFSHRIEYHLNPDFSSRELVGDDPANSNERYYGNNDYNGPDGLHGTHVAGIVAAERQNKMGIQGIAEHARIMTLRVTPNGDERDKDVANAIRYAADNGARIINMSFGKYYTEDKQAVDEAVKYALAKGLLFIKAAGNDNINLDVTEAFPNPRFEEGGIADAWITVGASNRDAKETLKAGFSNYGIERVDVFAPGVRIRSCAPNNQYKRLDGTSMAAPVVSGLAAMIWSYYPEFKSTEIKDIIMKSVIKHETLSTRCKTGGVVNAYNALLLAKEFNQKKKKN